MEQHHVLVVGGGNAGISTAARLLRDGASDVAVMDGRSVHRYRPLLNYVGAGQASMSAVERPMRDVVPDGCTWIPENAVAVDPTASTVRSETGRTLHYSTLIVCPGMEEDWAATPGLHAAYAGGWAASTFVPSAAAQVWPTVQSVRHGSVLFTVPPEPSPCSATALKPLFMACDHWRRTGVLQNLQVRLVLPGASAVGLPAADAVLDRRLASYGIEVLRSARVERVDHVARSVTVTSQAGPVLLEDVAFAHVVPHYRAPGWVAESGLGDGSPTGLVDIDPETLRHRRHEAIWALGDAARVETRPSGGALRHQVDVLARNIAAARGGGSLSRYDGYTVMPITVSRRELMLIEVDRDGQPAPSVPVIDLDTARRSTWLYDRHVLPRVYFRRILRGKV